MTTKTPQDRKSKVTRKDGVATLTIDGVTVSVSDDAINDFELLMDLADLEDGNGAKIASVFRRLVGDQARTVLDALRGENGRVTVQAAGSWVTSLIRALNPNS